MGRKQSVRTSNSNHVQSVWNISLHFGLGDELTESPTWYSVKHKKHFPVPPEPWNFLERDRAKAGERRRSIGADEDSLSSFATTACLVAASMSSASDEVF